MTDSARYVVEPPKDTGYGRSAYERDRARVLHSAAFRRLAAKTQVHSVPGSAPPGSLRSLDRLRLTAGNAGSADFLRTRLTHSLEVAQIAREMGERLGCDPDVVDVAGLAHDLGHPPFGHNGEDALDGAARACGGFEGNAQTFRVLTRLEAKVPGAGLNLTRASLDATCKYPWQRRDGERKFGVYADDTATFEWVRDGAPADRRCLEAQVMDWADDVAYSVHDVEDGIYGGYVALGDLADPDERAALCADVAEVYSVESAGDLAPVLIDLLREPVLAALVPYDGTYGAQVALKRATSVLTGRFVAAAVVATRAKFGEDAVLRRYAADLIVPRETRAQCALLKGIALRYVMRRRGAEEWYARQREILTELVSALADRAPDGLDPVFAPLWLAVAGDPARLRVVVDQVASLTDPAAVAWHDGLVG